MSLYQSSTQWSHPSLVLPLSSRTSWISLLALTEPDGILATTSLDSILPTGCPPVFPSGHRPPFFTLIDLEEHRTDGDETHTGLYERQPIVVTAPTIPRMKVILEEKIVVDRWMVREYSQPSKEMSHV